MDSPLMRIFSIIISTIIFFIFPVYITFEKKDDIAYSMSSKATYDFVENVSNKGFISIKMYQKLIDDLSATYNTFDIEITHKKKRYDPVIYIYTNNSKTELRDKVDYILNKNNSTYFNKNGTLKSNMEFGVEETEEIHTTDEILSKLGGDDYVDGYKKGDINRDGIINSKDENLIKNYNLNAITFDVEQQKIADINNDGKIDGLDVTAISTLVNSDYTVRNKGIYVMNIGDELNVKIRNTNTTIATVLYNAFTLGSNTGTNLRMYANLSTVIKNELYMTNY